MPDQPAVWKLTVVGAVAGFGGGLALALPEQQLRILFAGLLFLLGLHELRLRPPNPTERP